MKNMSKKIVIALGGNALGKTPSEQKEALKLTGKIIVDLFSDGHKIIVCHGNGPQVGMIQNSFNCAFKNSVIKEFMPLSECVAMSQGYIGFDIQNAVKNEFIKRNLNDNHVVSLITQTIVNGDDNAFENPSKPIGEFMNKAEAEKVAKENNWTIKEDAGRGYRRVVPSPKPIKIVETNAISALSDLGFVVIAGGGGGVPVRNSNNKLNEIDAVIDKDFTSAKIAELVNADTFIILTAVDKIMINFGKPNQKPIDNIHANDLQELLEKNTFAEGSMKPKVEAVLSFVKATSNPAYIANLKFGDKVLEGDVGTKIIK